MESRPEFIKSVKASANQVRIRLGLRWQDIDINERRQTVAVGGFPAQGESAQQLIDEVPDDINPRTWMLFIPDSAGAL